jgi:hypothetical protein
VIEPGVPATWPDAVREALRPFLQGHLIEEPAFFYNANLDQAVWALSAELRNSDDVPDEERTDTIADLARDQRPRYGILTTQTCDLSEEGRRKPRQPWVQVAPVYRLAAGDTALGRDYVHALDPPEIEGEVWAADLRIEMPLEKSVLVGREPIEAFRDEGGYVDFAKALARRRGRPALASIFHEVITTSMRQLKEETSQRRSQARRVRDQVYALRVDIADGTRLDPKAAQLYVVLKGDRDEDTKDWFDEWWDRARVVGEEHGLQLLETVWLDARNVNACLYDQLIEVSLPI